MVKSLILPIFNLGLFLCFWAMKVFASEYEVFNNLLGVAFFISLIVHGWLYRNKIIKYLRSRQFKLVLAQLVNIFLVLCILGVTNYLIFKRDKVFDLTKDKVHSLSEQSKKVMASFNSKLEMTLFAKRSDWNQTLDILRVYENFSDIIELNVFDIEEKPALTRMNKVESSNTLVVKYKNKKVAGVITDELSITNLLLKASLEAKITIGYTTGHGELSFRSVNSSGLSFLKDRIEESNYSLKEVDLLSQTSIPNDIDILLVIDPKSGFLDLEIGKIEQYLAKGGNLLTTISPQFSPFQLSNYKALLQRYGIRIYNSIVLDRLSTIEGIEATIPIVSNLNTNNQILTGFKGRMLFPLSIAMTLKPFENVKVSWLAKTSIFPGSWAESDLNAVKSGRAQYDSKDLKGPLFVAAIAESLKNNSRVVVIGSSTMFTNSYSSQTQHFNFFLNSLGWLVNQQDLISLNRPTLKYQKIHLGSAQVTLIFWIAIIFVPFLFFFIAFWTFRKSASA